jgi:hypothetical protein
MEPCEREPPVRQVGLTARKRSPSHVKIRVYAAAIRVGALRDAWSR